VKQITSAIIRTFTQPVGHMQSPDRIGQKFDTARICRFYIGYRPPLPVVATLTDYSFVGRSAGLSPNKNDIAADRDSNVKVVLCRI
jgi:hypothetical protein